MARDGLHLEDDAVEIKEIKTKALAAAVDEISEYQKVIRADNALNGSNEEETRQAREVWEAGEKVRDAMRPVFEKHGLSMDGDSKPHARAIEEQGMLNNGQVTATTIMNDMVTNIARCASNMEPVSTDEMPISCHALTTDRAAGR